MEHKHQPPRVIDGHETQLDVRGIVHDAPFEARAPPRHKVGAELPNAQRGLVTARVVQRSVVPRRAPSRPARRRRPTSVVASQVRLSEVLSTRPMTLTMQCDLIFRH